MKDLQEHINEEAERQLQNDILDFLNLLRNQRCFIAINNQKTEDGHTFHKFFWPSLNSPAFKILFDELRPEYIEKISKNYFNKLDQ